MVVLSWEGKGVETIAKELQCSAQTVRCQLHRFDAEGIEGLGDRPRSGRPSRLTEGERSKLITLGRKAPPREPVEKSRSPLNLSSFLLGTSQNV